MHMDDFERLLEIQLARLLDPVVEGPHPPRKRRKPPVALVHPRPDAGGLDELPPDIVVLDETDPLAVAVRVTAGTLAF
jgi:hypothetical protein